MTDKVHPIAHGTGGGMSTEDIAFLLCQCTRKTPFEVSTLKQNFSWTCPHCLGWNHHSAMTAALRDEMGV